MRLSFSVELLFEGRLDSGVIEIVSDDLVIVFGGGDKLVVCDMRVLIVEFFEQESVVLVFIL